MYQTIKSIVLPVVVVTAVGFVIILLNQTLQLAALASQVHPLAGQVVLVVVLAVFALGTLYPLYAYLRLPEPLIPPAATSGPEYDTYRERLAKRLAGNPKLARVPAKGLDLDRALRTLDGIAEERTKEFASKVFLGTAISQNGSVDSLLVLAAQGRLVYEIACIYHQRPHLRELAYLYTNVAATAFIAGELEDIDVGEQIQPIVTAVLGSSVAAIPGMSAAAGLFVNSIVTGAGNAYLTLRVGILAREYCRLHQSSDRRSRRRSAAIEAIPLLGSIVSDGAAAVASSIWSKPKKFFQDMLGKIKWPWSSTPATAE
jgi:hypothetical protein